MFRVLIVLIVILVGLMVPLSVYVGVRYHELAIKACRKIGRKLHLIQSVPDPKYKVLTDEQDKRLSSAVKISFTGDLILLRDMVERAYNVSNGKYDFETMFSHIKPHLLGTDLNIGVFEGPMSGADTGFSSSNYDDGIRLFINFPDEFGYAVKNAGYGLVTLANNHLFDKGLKGQERTLDVLDAIGLDHMGSYRNQKEHNTIKIVNVRGLKVAFLAYTYGCEYTEESFFFEESTAYRTDTIVSRRSKYFRQNKRKVIQDFNKVKELNPDLVIVLPHIGKQFRHYPDKDQKTWCNLFVELGADIIFSCHPHAVQPIEWRKNKDGKKVLISYCPGNFINSYIQYDGDASMIVEAYIDPETHQPFAVGCKPIYCYCNQTDGSYTAIPIVDAICSGAIKDMSCADYKRICEVQKLVTKTALGVEIPIHNIQNWYISFAETGYARHKVNPLVWKAEYYESRILELLKQARKVCFVGDSITDGMKNGGYGWFEPMMQMFPNIEVDSFALGAQTSVYFVENKDIIAEKKADVYVIAIGCNDIRYRNPKTCAMNEKDYINNIRLICEAILTKQLNAKIVFISPWMSLDPDRYCRLNKEEKEKLYDDYAEALSDFALRINALFINPNPYFANMLKNNPRIRENIYLDHIHPNADFGIRFFSEACILS